MRIMRILNNHALKIVILIAIMLRLGMLFVFSDIFDFVNAESIHGSDAYDEYALNLLETGVYGRTAGIPDAAIPPMYSYVLAGVYALFGRGFVQLGLFHIVLDVLSITLVYDICRRLFREEKTLWGSPIGRWVGVLAGLMTACYAYLIFQNLTLIDTPFWMFMLHLFVWLIVLLRQQEGLTAKTWGIAILAGVALGIATLARSITPPLALLVALWLLFRLNIWQAFLRLLPVAVMSILCLMPWIIRNYQIFDAFVPMSTTSGGNFWQGNSPFTIPVFEAGYDVQWTAPEVQYERLSREADAERFDLALEYLRENPEQIPRLIWTKFLVQWSVEITPRNNPQEGETFALDDNGDLLIVRGDGSLVGLNDANTSYNSGLIDTVGRPVQVIYFGSLLLLAIIGVILSAKQWRDVSLLWFVQISMTLMYVIFHPSTRYRVPTDPLLFAFSAYALVMFIYWWQSRRKLST